MVMSSRKKVYKVSHTSLSRSSIRTWKNLENNNITNNDKIRKFNSSRNIVSAMHTSGIVYLKVSFTRC